MNKEKQRIKIAEACGWTSFEKAHGYAPHPTGIDPLDGRREDLSDYLNDLNAMHEAEKAIPDDKIDEYKHRLCIAATTKERITQCATAAQRAEAFLRTLNLWEQ